MLNLQLGDWTRFYKVQCLSCGVRLGVIGEVRDFSAGGDPPLMARQNHQWGPAHQLAQIRLYCFYFAELLRCL